MNNQKLNTIGTGSFCDEFGKPNVQSSTLIRKWRVSSNSKWFFSFFAVFWNICILSIYNDVTSAKDFPTQLITLIFPAVGVYFAYLSLALWVNKTTISFNTENLMIRKFPLPWLNDNLNIPISEINSVYTESYASHYYGENDNNPVIAYKVMAQVKFGPDVCIDRGFAFESDALILEAWINHNLKLSETPKFKFSPKPRVS